MKHSFITTLQVFILFLACIAQNVFYSQPNQLNKHYTLGDTSTEASQLDYTALSQLPVMHEGRIKPLSTFANLTLNSIAHATTVDGKTATEWFIGLMLNPKQDYSQARFYINNIEILRLLNLSERSKHLYSFIEVLPGIKQNISLITSIENKAADKSKKLQHNEQILLNLYHSTLVYFDLSRTLTLLLPEFNLAGLQ